MNPPADSATQSVAEIRRLCDSGQWEEVLAQAQRWQGEFPGQSRGFFYAGVALAGMGRFVESETAYRKALKRDEGDFRIWNNLAALLFQALNRPAEAAQCLACALKVDPNNKLGWANLASMNGQLNRHAQALECAERALAIDPQFVEAHLHRARAAQSLGRMEIVRAATEALSKLPPEKFRRSR